MPPQLINNSKPKTKHAIECPICRDYGVIELSVVDREHSIETLCAAIIRSESTLCVCESGKIWRVLFRGSRCVTDAVCAKLPEVAAEELAAVEQRMWNRIGRQSTVRV